MRRTLTVLAIALAAAALLPAAAQAAFGLNNFDVTYTEADGTPNLQAGSHPFALNTSFGLNFDSGTLQPEGWVRDLSFNQVPGLLADTTAYPQCTNAEFLGKNAEELSACPLDTQVGITAVSASEPTSWSTLPVYNLTPPPGSLARLGFTILNAHIIIEVGLNHNYPYNGIATLRNTSQVLEVFGGKTQLWGDPSAKAHEELRGSCGMREFSVPLGTEVSFEGTGKDCPLTANPKPFLTLPTDCSGPLTNSYEALSWESAKDSGSRLTHDAGGNPVPFSGCGNLPPLHPAVAAVPTSRAPHSPTGLDLSIDVDDPGLTSVEGISQSRIKKLTLSLPEGMSANPSLAEGLEVCSEEDLARETVDSAPGEGCPEGSKIGTVEVESPLVNEAVKGALYVATPRHNLAHNSLIALYIVIKNQNLGIIVKQATRVEPDPKTGQLIGIAEEIPQLPFSHLRLHFREGGRSPLVSPPICGTYAVGVQTTPWSGAAPVLSSSTFQILPGPGEDPSCPAGATPPFGPGFEAGSQNNAAGSYSPFSLRLTRRDGDQDLTRFDATLPPGIAAKLAGVDKCPDAQIALAKTKTGTAELRSPSCPANSKIGTIEAGAGVGSQLTYVPGSVYLAGPFGGQPLSVVGIVPAVAGPFDVGTVVVRQALAVNPRTGEVSVDGAHSDPIPHILEGIPLLVRDIQVHVDRREFAIDPTNCDPFAVRASIWGGGTNLFSSADDSPVQREARYQAANCSRLGFKPKLSLKLKGGTRRGDHPKLRAVLQPRAGDANLAGTVVRLPHSAFLDQGHIKTICTRVQYAAKACPQGSIYGHVRAFTPLLSEPLEGPAYLRSSNHNLPDLVFSLHGLLDLEAVARLDSKNGGIRATFTGIPDAPISKTVVQMQGGKKGLIVNSTNLCAEKHRADVQLDAQSGKRLTIEPVLQASCSKRKKHK